MIGKIVVRPLVRDDFDRWNEIVRLSSAGTIYHDSRWLIAISRAVNDSLVIYGFFNEGRLLAAVPLQVRRRGPLSIARRAFATPYAHPVCDPHIPEINEALTGAASKSFLRAFSQTILTFSPYDQRPAGWVQGMAEQRATYLLNIAEPRGVWRQFSSEVRNRIRRAEKSGITVTEEPDFLSFYELYRDTFARQGEVIPFTAQSFSHLLETITMGGFAHQYLARFADGTLAAACLILHDHRRAYYSLAASHEELRKTGATSLLVWHSIQEISQKVTEYDFGGANVPSVKQFKHKFRGRLVMYPEITYCRTYPERILIRLYKTVQHVKR